MATRSPYTARRRALIAEMQKIRRVIDHIKYVWRSDRKVYLVDEKRWGDRPDADMPENQPREWRQLSRWCFDLAARFEQLGVAAQNNADQLERIAAQAAQRDQ